MLSYAVAVLSGYLAVASSRDSIRPLPTITNSLVNLGKMEMSFYFNDPSPHAERTPRAPVTSFMRKPELSMDECPCSNFRNVKDSVLTNPAGLLNKILMSNDLFSSNKEPVISTLCCDSHEHVQEGTVIFEFPANSKNLKPFTSRNNGASANNMMPLQNRAMPMMPFLFDSIIPNKSSMLPQLKTKSIEIFLIPKKKDQVSLEVQKQVPKKKDLISKDNIQIVGDKELKNNVSFFKPVLPVVKKDLTFQEKNEKLKEKEKEQEKEKELEKAKELEKDKDDLEKEEVDQMIIEPASKPNAV